MTDGSRTAALDTRLAGSLSGTGTPSLRARLAYLLDVTVHLVRRDFATRHRGSVLGWLWALGPPLLQLLVTYFLFSKVIPLNVPNYPVFLLTGILAWNCFARSVALSTVSLEQQRALALRPGFPIAVLPVKAVLIGLLDYVLALPILLIATAIGPGLYWSVLFMPVLLAIQLVMMVGLGWALGPLQVFLRDVQHLVGLLLMLGFWLTPVFYQAHSVPPQFHWLYQANPMAHLIGWQREVLLEGALPGLGGVALLTAVVAVMAAVGAVVFRTLQHAVPEEL
jgi:lipopolysaccharide transport system permease protein